jgi:hypothetical protein
LAKTEKKLAKIICERKGIFDDTEGFAQLMKIGKLPLWEV